MAELLPGGGYFTRLISKASSATTAMFMRWCRLRRPMRPASTPDFSMRVRALAADPHYSNVSVVTEPFTQLADAGAGRSGVDVAELS